MNPFGVERRTEQTLWDVRDVARFLKAAVSWVYKAAQRGDLPCAARAWPGRAGVCWARSSAGRKGGVGRAPLSVLRSWRQFRGVADVSQVMNGAASGTFFFKSAHETGVAVAEFELPNMSRQVSVRASMTYPARPSWITWNASCPRTSAWVRSAWAPAQATLLASKAVAATERTERRRGGASAVRVMLA